ncbi:flavin reductase family protein [Catelliglobosispora koreensis]|uniref:flavin reductase family protein n=1 Tax=Catelliglobosispora koreensis TaxID=129052 RepID=UPI000366EA3B|nr:flavin reductase family protein [Catelliglobosispora koreensis]
MTQTTDAPTGIDPHTFRAVLRNQASSVTIVTAPGPAGLTVTSFTSVSLRPQLVSFIIGDTASARPAIESASYVAIHLLRAGQENVARVFATSGIDRFADQSLWRPGPYGLPMLHDALAVLICSVTGRLTVGDHIVVLGTPVSASQTPGEPLLYHRGSYTTLTP